ncbi:hypothetical protein Gohar_021929 [Gossypium harknessii]|uniref:RNase H type-1 domain-containing protein n=1 Tax=Gossypium harknessii TaxID=34285 RepID=A0A7J9I5P1_9ROSI|nr:hypothetical protein [Gossypium harknessii]
MASCIYLVENVRDPTMVEAWACLQAVTFAEDLGFREVCMEGDALTVIRKLKAANNDKSTIRKLINEIKKNRISSFRRLTFRYIPRRANEAIDVLGTKGREYDAPIYWIKEGSGKSESENGSDVGCLPMNSENIKMLGNKKWEIAKNWVEFQLKLDLALMYERE